MATTTRRGKTKASTSGLFLLSTIISNSFLMLLLMTLLDIPSTILGAEAILPSTISYYVTVRDFMSARCISTASPTTFNSQCPSNPAVRQRVRADEISGHPDFERSFGTALGFVQSYRAPFSTGTLPLPRTQSSGNRRPFVLSTLKFGPTGIGTIQYCKGEEPGYQCDFNQGDATRSVFNEQSFSTWYQDNPRFNIRSGYQQVLFLNPATEQYSYKANGPGNQDVDGNGFYDPVIENGLNGWGIAPVGSGKNFWFTTEIHASFQYRGDELFRFDGDDDVHVFINRKLAINLGGVHGSNGVDILLNDFESDLGLVVGQIYEFDLFHAERQTVDSNYGLTTTLSEACNVVNAGIRTQGADVDKVIDWTSTGSTNNSDWFVVAGRGYGEFSSNPNVKSIDLMTPGITNSVGYMFFSKQLNVGSGFSLSFKFKMNNGEGHGFAVVLHDRELGLRDLNGGMGPNLGVRNTDNSFAILFDMCPDYPAPCNNKQQLRLHYKIDGDKLNSPFEETRHVHDPNVVQDWTDGQDHLVEIFYYEFPDWLEVYVDKSLRLVEKGFDIQQVIGGRDASVGFTATSSDLVGMRVTISEVTASTIKVVERFTVLDDEDLPPKVLVANGRDSLTFTIKTKDACENAIEFGGLSELVQGRLVGKANNSAVATESNEQTLPGGSLRSSTTNEPSNNGRRLQQTIGDENEELVTVFGTVEDNNNGEYTIRFKTTVLTSFSLHLAFGSGCVWNGTEFTANEQCFALNSPDAVFTLPFETLAPTIVEEPEVIPQATLIGIGVSSGVIFTIGSMLILVGVRVRNRWRRDKRFIEAGRFAAMERDLQYVGDAELDALQQKLQATIHAIQAERAKSRLNGDEHQATIQALLREKGELQEVVRRIKAKMQGLDPDAEITFGQHISMMGQNVRKSFAQARVSQRVSKRISQAISWGPNRRLSSRLSRDDDSGDFTSPLSRLRMSVSRGFNKMYNGTPFSSSSMVEQPLHNSLTANKGEQMSSVNPLYLSMMKQARGELGPAGEGGRPTTGSTDSTLSMSAATTMGTSPPTHTMSSGNLGLNNNNGTAPRVPPRPAFGTISKIDEDSPPSPWNSAPRVPPRPDAGTIGSVQSNNSFRSGGRFTGGAAQPQHSSSSLSSWAANGSPPYQTSTLGNSLTRPPPAPIDDSI